MNTGCALFNLNQVKPFIAYVLFKAENWFVSDPESYKHAAFRWIYFRVNEGVREERSLYDVRCLFS